MLGYGFRNVVLLIVSIFRYLMFRPPFGICRKEWPHIVPSWHKESSIREAYLSRHTALNQFKYADPQLFESYLVGKPPHHLLFSRNSIILSQVLVFGVFFPLSCINCKRRLVLFEC